MNDINAKQVRMSLNDGEPVKCSGCGGYNFMELIRFFKFSALLMGAPKDSIMPVPVYVCGQCGSYCEEMLPNDLKTKPKIDLSNIEIKS